MRYSSFLFHCIFATGLLASAAQAETFTVTNNNDSGPGSLREAILAGNAIPGSGNVDIEFNSGANDIVLSSSLPIVTRGIFFKGEDLGSPNKVKVRRLSTAPQFRLFDFAAGAYSRLQGIELSGGSVADNGGLIRNVGALSLKECALNGGKGIYGGGLYNGNGATLYVESCTLSGNTGRDGGAIFSSGDLNIFSSTLTANQAERGGAIETLHDKSSASNWFTNSTWTANTASVSGGAIYVLNNYLTLDSCTILGNSAPVGTGAGLAVSVTSDSVLRPFIKIGNTILAGNTPIPGGNGTSFDFSQDDDKRIDFISQGHNLVGSGSEATTPFTATGDQNGFTAATAGVGPLADNGGPTQTMSLLSGSPALNTGETDLTTDQRGAGRNYDGADDIGAFEGLVTGNHPPVSTGLGFGARIGSSLSIQLNATDIDGDKLTYKIVGGKLPKGVQLDPDTGFLSGTPSKITSNGLFSFQVSDGQLTSNTSDVSFSIAEQTSPVVTTSGPANWFDDETSLSEAVDYCVEHRENSTITFDLPVGDRVISLSQPLTSLFEDLSIVGPTAGGGVTIQRSDADGTPQFGIFQVKDAKVTIKNLTLKDGDAGDGSGGAISNDHGLLRVENCALVGNTAFQGGAVYSLTETDSTSTTLVNCTLANNIATALDVSPGSGGAVAVAKGKTNIDSCTIVGNRAAINTGAGLAVASNDKAQLSVSNSIVAGNLALGEGNTSNTDVVTFSVPGNSAGFVSGGHNLIGDGNGTRFFNAAKDTIKVKDADLKLGDLADNGGPTPTMAVRFNSPALDHGLTTLVTDQRGQGRPSGNSSDIGAFEAKSNLSPTIQSVTLSPEAPLVSDNLTVLVKATDPEGGALTNSYRWTRIRKGVSKVLPFKTATLALTPADFAPGDVVKVDVIVSDDFSEASGSAQVTLGNHTIEITDFRLQPRSPYTDELVGVTVKTKDADKTRAGFTYVWTCNHEIVRSITTRNVQDFLDLKPKGRGDKGDVIEVTVTATDGVSNATAKGEVTVRNSAPVLMAVSLIPNSPIRTDVIAATYNGRDADGDELTRTYLWRVGNRILKDEKGSRLNLAKYPFVKVGDVVSVDVQLSDGDAVSKTLSAKVSVVAETPPTPEPAPLMSNPSAPAS